MDKYKFKAGVTIDSYDEGGLISIINSNEVLCLGKFELDLLSTIVDEGLDKAIHSAHQQYNGDNIDEDILDFCHDLEDKGVIEKI